MLKNKQGDPTIVFAVYHFDKHKSDLEFYLHIVPKVCAKRPLFHVQLHLPYETEQFQRETTLLGKQARQNLYPS